MNILRKPLSFCALATPLVLIAAPAAKADFVNFQTTIVVSPFGPTEQDNCLELLAELDSIVDASVENPYLIRIEPGVYDCGAQRITMKPFVNIVGSGPNMTFIKGSAGGEHGVVTLVSNAELHGLSVVNRQQTGNRAQISVAIGTNRENSLVDWRVEDVAAGAFEGTTINYAIFLDSTDRCDGELEDVSAEAFAVGALPIALEIECSAGEIRIADLTALSDDGPAIRKTGASNVTVQRSEIIGQTDRSPSIAVLTTGGTLRFVNTQLDGSVDVFGLGVARCLFSYDEIFNPFSADCQNSSISTGVLQTQ